ncbi:MAG TPA: sugar phosphate nucleotidyltransferase [Candidatus Sulfomarinibacteraceae bacterium]|nr:sugar phosphate nucleotidyltransferase [Candidatus Sulfomarinibacteraceae bacterium]
MRRHATWVIVLAGGDGHRLSSLTRNSIGTSVPKQFCSPDGGPTLLELALARAERLTTTERTLVSVTARHRPWWRNDLAIVPPGNVVVQPRNRGTLAGVLLPLLEVAARDPLGRVVVIPSDHHVADEVALETVIRRALADLDDEPEAVVLLGIDPETFDPDYGWILPEPGDGDGPRGVSRFAEKPDPAEASALLARGALLNSFILAARVSVLVDLCQSLAPVDTWCLRVGRWDGTGDRRGRLAATYANLADGDFSRDILARCPGLLLVRAVPPCGWCDLGTPARVARWTGRTRTDRTGDELRHRDRPILASAAARVAASGPIA